MKTARDLKPGDTYATADGVPHVVGMVHHLSHQSTIFHTDGSTRLLFPNVRVAIEEPNPD